MSTIIHDTSTKAEEVAASMNDEAIITVNNNNANNNGKKETNDASVIDTATATTTGGKKAKTIKYSVRNKRKREWIDSHALQYGIKIVEHDPLTGKVSKVSCRFCIHFGREQEPAAIATAAVAEVALDDSNDNDNNLNDHHHHHHHHNKRRRKTDNIKFFKKPFRTDKYQSHLESEHRTKWEQFKHLSNDWKASFFDCHHNNNNNNNTPRISNNSAVAITSLSFKTAAAAVPKTTTTTATATTAVPKGILYDSIVPPRPGSTPQSSAKKNYRAQAKTYTIERTKSTKK
jgi:hypothetical protein